MPGLWIIGSGGHAREVLECLRAAGHDAAGFLDDNEAMWGERVAEIPVSGPVDADTIERLGVTAAVIAIGANTVRQAIAARLDGLVRWEKVIHPTATIAPDACIGPGVMISAHVVVQPGVTIGAHTIINTGTIVSHDCTIGDFVHVAPGSVLTGNVTVDDGAFLGAAVTVIPMKRIGAWSVIGAGACVTNDIPANVTAVGVPAKVIQHH